MTDAFVYALREPFGAQDMEDDDLTKLAKSPDVIEGLKLVLRGRAKIVKLSAAELYENFGADATEG